MHTSALVRLAIMLLAAVAGALVPACAADAGLDTDGTADAIKKDGESPPWIYEGPMPALASAELVVSITGHTLRVTGKLPEGYDAARLPWYALAANDGTARVTVVYPVATGMEINGKWNNVPGRYNHLNVRPYRPKDAAQTGREHWGGFPFLNYHDERRFALHGPIDFADDADVDGDGVPDADWRLVRGRVSKGCQRMQGEHVLELTHMLGFDMGYPHATRENVADPKNGVEGKYIPTSLVVLPEGELDQIPSENPGGEDRLVDVDYPKHASVGAWPDGKPVFVAPTWDANEMRSWACAVQPADNPNLDSRVPRRGGRFDGSYCGRTHGKSARAPTTGALLP